MFNKNLMVLAIFLVGILAVGAVSAQDNASDVAGIEDMESDDIKIIKETGNDELIGETDNGTFTDLQNKINEAAEGSVVNLENDYEYDEGFTISGITVDKQLTINGNGFTINGMDSARIFNVTVSQNLIFQNITFMNGYAIAQDDDAGNGGAILLNGGSVGCIITDCKFIGNTADKDGGAIYSEGTFEYNTIMNSEFTNNIATQNGGALYFLEASNANIFENVNFTNNKALFWDGGAVNFFRTLSNTTFNGVRFTKNSGSNGGALNFDGTGNYVSSENNVFINTEFADNTAQKNGGAIYYLNDALSNTYASSAFFNNIAKLEDGGAMCYFEESVNEIFENIAFINNTGRNGGALNFDYYVENATFKNMTFSDNVAQNNGGAFYVLHSFTGNTFTDSVFTNNTAAKEDGGAIDFYRKVVGNEFSGLVFINNTARNGGAVNIDNMAVNNTYDNIVFSNNTASRNGGAFYVISDFSNNTFKNSVFENNIAQAEDGGAINFHGNVAKNEFDMIVFVNNEGNNGGAINVDLATWNNTYNSMIFANNKARRNGGAFFILYNVMGDSFLNSVFANNTAVKEDGGAINVYGYLEDALFDNNTFTNNTALHGGAINVDMDVQFITISNSKFESNVAGRYGGVISADNLYDSTFTKNAFNKNTAEISGAVMHIYYNAENLIITDSSFIENSANEGIIDLSVNANDTFILGNFFANNTAEAIISINSSNSSYINDNVFINDNATYDIDFGSMEGLDVNNNWFGQNSTTYSEKPKISADIYDTWLFLNGVANPNVLFAGVPTDVVFSMLAYNSTAQTISEYDSSDLPALNLTVNAEGGSADKEIVGLGEAVKFTPSTLDAKISASLLSAVENVNLTVSMAATKIENLTVDGTGFISGVLVNELEKPIENATLAYIINGVEANLTTDDYGEFFFEVPTDAEVEIIFAGTQTLMPTNASIILHNIAPQGTATVIEAEDLTQYACDYYAGERGGKFTFRLLDQMGNPIAKKNVFIGYNGVTYNRTTDENGYASLQINLKNAGLYTFVLVFLGDNDYNASMAVHKITINKKPITITASAKTFKASAKTKKYTVTLKTKKCSSADGKTYLEKGKKVTLKINGVTYTAKTNAKGQATFSLKITKKGKFTTAINFAGDNTYEKASKSVKITIK